MFLEKLQVKVSLSSSITRLNCGSLKDVMLLTSICNAAAFSLLSSELSSVPTGAICQGYIAILFLLIKIHRFVFIDGFLDVFDRRHGGLG